METNETKKDIVNELVFHTCDFSTPEIQQRIEEVVDINKDIEISLKTSSDPRDCKQVFK